MTPAAPARHHVRFPLNESIAVAALAALGIWALIVWSGQGGEPVPLGPLDPGRWFPGSTLTRADMPLVVMLILGGVPLVAGLLRNLVAGEFGSDLLAGISIVTSVVLGEYLAGVLVVLMLSGGEALEERAVSRAGDVLNALARRMPTLAHKKTAAGLTDIALSEVVIGDVIVVLPHEICPVDGTVVSGRGSMDENWGLLWMWHSVVVLGLSVITDVLAWQSVTTRWPYLVLWGGGLAVWAPIFWALRHRAGPVTAVERQIAHIWGGTVIASVLLFWVESLIHQNGEPLPVLTLSPVLALLAGLVFFAKAGILSGVFYIQAGVLFATALVMCVVPAYQHIIFGLVSAACFFVPGLKYSRQRMRA